MGASDGCRIQALNTEARQAEAGELCFVMTPAKKRKANNKAPAQFKPSRLKMLFRDDDYPLSLVASLAVQLHEAKPIDAARRAFQLLEACEEVAAERWAAVKEREWQRPDATILFNDAVRQITGHKDLEYATGKYRAVLMRAAFGGMFADDTEPAAGPNDDLVIVVDEVIRRQRKSGIPAPLVLLLATYLQCTDVKPIPPPESLNRPRKKDEKSS